MAAAAATSAAARSPLSVLGVCLFFINSSCVPAATFARWRAARSGAAHILLLGGLGLRRLRVLPLLALLLLALTLGLGRRGLELLGWDVVGRHEELGRDGLGRLRVAGVL